MRMRKHRPRVKAFDAMFVVKDELFSTGRRLLACTWRDKSSWIFRASAVWEILRGKIANADSRYSLESSRGDSRWNARIETKFFVNELAKAARLIDVNVVYVARDGHTYTINYLPSNESAERCTYSRMKPTVAQLDASRETSTEVSAHNDILQIYTSKWCRRAIDAAPRSCKYLPKYFPARDENKLCVTRARRARIAEMDFSFWSSRAAA